MIELLTPEWSAPDNVHALFTTRQGGYSQGEWATLNLARHVADDPGLVEKNRESLQRLLPSEPVWLNQVHSNHCVDLDVLPIDQAGSKPNSDSQYPGVLDADAVVTSQMGRVLAIMVADCLAILVASRSQPRLAAIHAGWRGLADGVIGRTIETMKADDLVAWLSPAIGPCHYEVGGEVRSRFTTASGFTARDDRWMLDLFTIARRQLAALGVTEIHGGGICTFCEAARFYSYRRDGVTGRMAALAWIT
jgi:YfiH family protein